MRFVRTAVAVFVLFALLGCVTRASLRRQPYEAPPERIAAIQKGIPNIRIGMSVSEVVKELGEPDVAKPYDVAIWGSDIRGHNFRYDIRYKAQVGSENDRAYEGVGILFDLDWNVKEINITPKPSI